MSISEKSPRTKIQEPEALKTDVGGAKGKARDNVVDKNEETDPISNALRKAKSMQ